MMPDGSWIQIEDLKGILDQFRPEILHPEDPKYVPLWRTLKAKCTNGIWYPQFNGLRFVPGRLGFFGVFGRFYDWSPRKERIVITPKVRDLEWHRAYYRTEMDGFSGFYNDDKYTSDSIIFEASKTDRKNIPEERWLQLFNSNGQFKEYIPPRENLFMIHEDIGVDRGHPLYYNDAKNHCELGARGGGKMAPLTEPVLTSNGWKKMGDIELNDKVYGRNGKLASVIGIHPQGKKRVWKVELQDGRVSYCGDEHLWTVKKQSGKEVVLSTKEIYKSGLVYKGNKGRIFKYSIPNCAPIDYEEKNLIIDPYVLGCLLGDGSMVGSTPKIASSDQFIIDEFKKRLVGFEIKHDSSTTNNYTIVDRDKAIIEVSNRWGNSHMSKTGNRLTQAIEQLGLQKNCKKKFIPQIYKEASIEQRLELIRGLMDTDGYISPDGHAEFTNTNELLIDDLAEVCRSLGIRCLKSIDTRVGQEHIIKGHKCKRGLYYRLHINTTKEIVKLPRKLNRLKSKKYQKRHDYVSIINIEPLEEFVEQQCITVDNEDHTYITRDYIVTHNSYWTALGDILADLCMDGSKYFDSENPVITTRAEIEVTCGGNEKSTEMLDKVVFGMNALADPKYPELGVFKYNEEDIEPCPFWKEMTGSYGTNNKGNPWINEYSIKRGNKWDHGAGNRDVVYNTQYAPNAKAAAQKSAGGRRTYVVHEEFGLNTEIESAWGSNEGMVTDSGHKQAGQKGIGTSGNIETILGAKKIMNNPKGFSCLVFEYNGSEHCWFLPTYMVDMKHKDENGNTDIEAAKEKALKIRQKKAESNEPSVYLEHIMNNPFYIDDMWVQGQGNLLPALEAEAREKELMQDGLYKELGTPIELFWDNMQPRGINYRIDKDAVPFYEYPFEPNRTTKRTVFMMYIHPSKLEVHGHIPNDAVIAVHDPYVSDEMDKGGSLGATYFVVNPKYIKDGLPGNCIAASLLGKAPNGVDDYNRMLHLGLYFYGDPIGCLWYEANRGDKLRSYFLRQKKLNSLCLRPQFEQGQYLYLRNVAQTGYMVSGQSRIFLLDAFSDWLLEDTELTIDGQTETKKNIQRIPCMFLLKQIKLYNQKENFDAVDAMQGLPLALGEQRHRIEAKTQSNSFSVISNYLKERRYARR